MIFVILKSLLVPVGFIDKDLSVIRTLRAANVKRPKLQLTSLPLRCQASSTNLSSVKRSILKFVCWLWKVQIRCWVLFPKLFARKITLFHFKIENLNFTPLSLFTKLTDIWSRREIVPVSKSLETGLKIHYTVCVAIFIFVYTWILQGTLNM